MFESVTDNFIAIKINCMKQCICILNYVLPVELIVSTYITLEEIFIMMKSPLLEFYSLV